MKIKVGPHVIVIAHEKPNHYLLTMTSDNKKDVSNNIPKDLQNTASGISQAELDSKQMSPESETKVVAIENNLEQNKLAKEVNGPKGLEPTRYGDWEAKGRCYDF